MLPGQCKLYLLTGKTVSKIWKFIHFSDYFLGFPIDILKDVNIAEFHISFGARNLNEEQRQSFKKFPKITSNPSLHCVSQILTEKRCRLLNSK